MTATGPACNWPAMSHNHHTTTTAAGKPATSRQRAYLRHLALTTGSTFVTPVDRADASRQIQRLQSRQRGMDRSTGRQDAVRERRAIARELAELPRNAARYLPEEISGCGATATWSNYA